MPAASASARWTNSYDVGIVHYVCGVGHVALPGDPAVTEIIKGFLLRGDPIPVGTFCPSEPI